MPRHLTLFYKQRLCWVAIALLLGVTQATGTHAATQGTPGVNSTGSIMISVTKHTVARISGLNDMMVSWDAADSDIVWTNDLCIYSSRSSGNYRVTGTGSRAEGGAFILKNGTKALPYQVFWNAGGAGNLSNEGVPLSPGVPASNLQGASTKDPNCSKSGSAATARLIINIPLAALNATVAGHYSESLTLLVSPD